MEKKKNTGLLVTVGLLLVLVLVVVILFGALLWNGIAKKGERERGSQTSSQMSKQENADLKEMHFVQSGYEFTVPADYNMTYADVAGTVIYQEDGFQMKMAVVNRSYEEVMANPKEFTQAIVDAGGSIEEDMKETEIDGKKYAYCVAALQGDKMLVIYTSAPDEGQRIAGQIVLQGENTSYANVIDVFASVASSAAQTDKADSTKDDIVVEMADKKPSTVTREWKGSSSMQFGNLKITHSVPENFYPDGSYDGMEYTAENYSTKKPYVDVNCSLFDIPWYENVESYIEENKHLNNTKIQTMNIDGKKIYYVTESFMNEDKTHQQIYAGFDLDKNQFYLVRAYAVGEEVELTMDTIREFLFVSEE